MKRLLFASLAVGAAAAAFAVVPSARGDGREKGVPGTVRADSVRNFTLKDLDGKARSLADWRDAKIVVLAWTAPGCPVAMVYAPRVAALSRQYEPKGVRFVGVVSGASTDTAEEKEAAAKAGIAFPVLVDADASLAERLGVETTTAVVVLDANRRVRYRGAVDDQYGVSGRKAEPSRRLLVDVLDALLAGGSPQFETTPAPGCPIDGPAAGKTPSRATWNRDVAAVVHRRCATCHRPDEAGPFSLLTYADAKKRSAAMRDAVSDGRMPPWHAEGEPGTFSNDRRLAPEEKETLLGWLSGGTPEGDGSPPAPPSPLSKDGWETGKPDAVLSFAKAERVPAEGVVSYRFVEIQTAFAEDRWVEAVEVKPGAPQVVHHVLVAIAPPDRRHRAEAFTPTNGFFAAMVPGGRSMVYPPGTGKRLPKGATLVFQMHYTPNGVAAEDRTSIGFRFLKEPPRQEVRTVGAFNASFRIPPGAPDWEVAAALPVPWDVHVLAFMPHMHLRGKSFRYSILRGLAKEETLLRVPRFDFNWQTPYRLSTPVAVRKGSIFKAVGTFDNSAGNPYNPDPSVEVRWGDQTWDEMMIGYVDYVRDGETPESREKEREGK